ncbi:MBL fold metallo-hydrolase [Natrinema halophilum]|uniref:MBL fold metallo-hydrolase n=1 Tax=Natrinema halophilum TaxID=1699371 RepID=UPI001F21D31E|nr:MBL fold metallo-hydrolase [Natrinema halophilum]UHQ96142.1 MBL fold metallo-hydrolase [Natrinema halophilum]
MEVSFQHANPFRGNESYVLRFADNVRNQTACILVDAGTGVEVESLLDSSSDDYLAAVLLTHAHVDHYSTLAENIVHQAPVYAASDTAAILPEVFAVGTDHYDLENTDAVLDAVEPIDGWEQVTADIRVRPIPAGHAPGAAGFCIQFDDCGESHTLLATGDFTCRRAAGYPGLETAPSIDVDGIFLTGTTANDLETTLTDAVGTILTRAQAGSTTLVTTSGLTGVHLAYLLANAGEQYDIDVPISLVGHVAKLATRLEYDHDALEFVPEFHHSDRCLASGQITIAGPEVPVDGSARRLFQAIREDAGATLVQVTNGGPDPVSSAPCTVYEFTIKNHPTKETIDEVVDALSPTQIVIVHQTGSNADRYKDQYDSFVWATDDDEIHTLYDDGWQPPPWVTEATRQRVRTRSGQRRKQLVGDSVSGLELSFPRVERASDVDLEAEGLNVTTLHDRLANPSAEFSANASSSESLSEMDVLEPERETTDDTTTDGRLQAILDRLDGIERSISTAQTEVAAQVVDAGDESTLLRVHDPTVFEDATHGDTVTIAVVSENE